MDVFGGAILAPFLFSLPFLSNKIPFPFYLIGFIQLNKNTNHHLIYLIEDKPKTHLD